MNPPLLRSTTLNLSPAAFRLAGAVASGLALAGSASPAGAQNVLLPPVEISDPIPSVETASSNWVGSANAPILRRPEGEQKYPLQLGPVRFHPHLGYQVIYGDGILRGTNNPSSTWLHTFSPGVYLELGQHWDFDFTAAINHYSNARFNDNTGLYFGLRGLLPGESWTWRFGYSGAYTEQPVIETGSQILQNSHLLTLAGLHEINARFSFEANLSPEMRLTDLSQQAEPKPAISDYYTLSTMEWLNYRVTGRTTVGVGAGGGYNSAEPGVDWVYEQFKGRLVWLPGTKLSFQVNAGVQLQQYLAGGRSSEANPVFEANVVYHLFEPTTLLLTASHAVENAFLQDRFALVDAVSVAVRQRLFQQIYLTVQPAYNFREYRATRDFAAPDRRKDEYLSIYAGLSARIFKRLDATLFYQYADNSSTADGLGFHTAQSGLRLDYRY